MDQPQPPLPPTGDPAETPAPTPSPGLPPAPPPAPAPGSGWQQPPSTWAAGQPIPTHPTLDVGAILGRSFDTLGREWSLFLLLAIPAGIGGFASSVLSPTMQAVMRDPTPQSGLDQAPSIVAQLLVALVSAVAAVAMIVTTDRYWRGTPIGLGEAASRAVALIPRAIGLLLLAIGVGIVVGVAFAAAFLVAALLGPIGGLLGLVGGFALLGVIIWGGARLAVVTPVLALEDVPLRAVFGRAWALTRGNALLIIGAEIAIGLVTLFPSWGGALFSLFVDDRIVAGIATGLASMVVAPLGAIWTTLAWAQLSGAPYHDNEHMATGKGRTIGFLVIAGVGSILFIIGGGLAAAGSEEFLRLVEAR